MRFVLFNPALGAGLLLAVATGSGCQLGTKPVPDQMSSSFQMSRDSLSFPNFVTGFDAAMLDASGMQRMFGDKVCVPGSSPCALTSAASTFMDQANASMSGGRCEGFAVLSDLMASQKLDATAFGAPTARELTLEDNPALQREIAYWFATQLVPDAVAAKTRTYMAKDVLGVLTDSFEEGAAEHYRIGIVRKLGKSITGGHSLTPIGFYRDPHAKGVYWLRVYDNNHPDIERLMKLDTVNNRWEFEASTEPSAPSRLYFGDASNNNPLYLAPVFSRQGVLPCPFCEGEGSQIVTAGGMQPSVATPEGTVGVADGELSATSGTSVTPSFSDPNDAEGASFVIGLGKNTLAAMGSRISVDVSAPPDPQNPDAFQSIGVLRSNVFTMARGLTVTATDTFTATDQGGSYTNRSRSPIELTTRLPTSSGDLTVTAFVGGGSDSVSAHVDPQTGRVSIQLEGATGSEVAVVVETRRATGERKAATFSVRPTGSVSFVAETHGWVQSGGQLTATVSNGGTTLTLTDACTDGVKSGSESDIDCGSSCEARCALGRACVVDADCASGVCDQNVCIPEGCYDRRKDANETGVDCGGPCAPCAVGSACRVSNDCADNSNNDCVLGTCRRVFTVGAAVSFPPGVGGGTGEELVLANGGEQITINGSGSYPFPSRTTGAYAVTVVRQSPLLDCTVSSGTGTASADVFVPVSCARRYAIGGFARGIPSGETVTLANNGASPLTLSQDGPFVFPAQPAGPYDVTVTTQPSSTTCQVVDGSGPTPSADITRILVDCAGAPTYTIGGTLAGMDSGKSIVLDNNGEQITLYANGPFEFPTAVTAAYRVSVATPPTGQTCVVTNDSGTATANVTSVTVTCRGPGRDPTFGTNGALTVAQTTNLDAWNALVVNPDGSVVLAGFAEVTAGSTQWIVSKVTAAGAVDTSFGSSGHRLITTGTGSEQAKAIARDANGLYVVAGTLAGTSSSDVGVVRLTSSGALDPSFGTNGVARFDFGGDESIEGVAVDGQGRIIVVGRQGQFPGDVLVVRLTSAGALDTGFGVNGAFTLPTTENDSLSAVVVDSTNAIIAVGESDADSLVLKLTASGGPDVTFGNTGRAVFDLTTGLYSDHLLAVALDGTRIVAAGAGMDAAASNYYLAGITSAGTLDTSFGAGGITAVGGATANEGFNALARGPGGVWYAAGYSDLDAAVLRFSAAGAQDLSFGTAGEFKDAFSGSAIAFGVGVDGLGRVVIAGTFSSGSSAGDLGIARINP